MSSINSFSYYVHLHSSNAIKNIDFSEGCSTYALKKLSKWSRNYSRFQVSTQTKKEYANILASIYGRNDILVKEERDEVQNIIEESLAESLSRDLNEIQSQINWYTGSILSNKKIKGASSQRIQTTYIPKSKVSSIINRLKTTQSAMSRLASKSKISKEEIIAP